MERIKARFLNIAKTVQNNGQDDTENEFPDHKFSIDLGDESDMSIRKHDGDVDNVDKYEEWNELSPRLQWAAITLGFTQELRNDDQHKPIHLL